MGKHTPGPWSLDEYISGRGAGPGVPACAVMCPNNNQVVCEIPDYCAYPEEVENNKANARLIAAAPELLAASKRVTAAFRAMGESRSLLASIFALRAECEASVLALDAAIAKATGETE